MSSPPATTIDKTGERRKLLETHANPERLTDYICSLYSNLNLAGNEGPVDLEIHYVPDRYVLGAKSFEAYLACLEQHSWETPEALGACALNDINNELICRWLQIRITIDSTQDPARKFLKHRVLLEDCQPGWNNPELISRIS